MTDPGGAARTVEDHGGRDRLGAEAGRAILWKGIQHAGVRAVSLARFLILARLLAPEDFGLLAVAAVALDLLLSLTDVGMVPALVQRSATDRRHYDTAWTVNLLRAGIIAAVILLTAPLIADVFAEPRAADIMRVLALRPVLDALSSIRIADLTRALRFRSITAVRLTASILEAVVAVALARNLGVWALVIGSLVGTAAGSAVSHVVAPYRPRLSLESAAAASLLRFGRWVFATGVLAVAGDALLRAVVSRRLGAADLGLYYVAVRVAVLPNEVISELVGSVAFPVHARLQQDRERAARVFRTTLKTTLALLIPLYAVIVAVAPSLVRHVLGAQWAGAAPIIAVIAVVGVIGAVFDATRAMLVGRGTPHWVAALFAVRLALVGVFVWELAGRFGVVGAAVAMLVAEVGVQVGAMVFAARLVPAPARGLGSPLAATAAAGAVGAVTAYLVDAAVPGALGLALAGGTGLMAAGASLWVLDHRLRLGVVADLLKAFPAVTTRLRLTRR